MTALLSGLLEANVYPPAISFQIVDPYDNYAHYRSIWDQRPGIPFLAPHVRIIRDTGDENEADEFLKSFSFQRNKPNTPNQVMVYNKFEQQSPPLHSHDIEAYLRRLSTAFRDNYCFPSTKFS